jgi:hypothetical protein
VLLHSIGQCAERVLCDRCPVSARELLSIAVDGSEAKVLKWRRARLCEADVASDLFGSATALRSRRRGSSNHVSKNGCIDNGTVQKEGCG